MTEWLYNKGFPWFSEQGSHVKGYLFDPEGQLLEGRDLLARLNSLAGADELRAFLTASTGLFALVLERDGEILLATDHARTFPVFYTRVGEEYHISDSVALLRSRQKDARFNVAAMNEFRSTGFVSGAETLAKGIMQVEAARIVRLRTGCKEKLWYWSYQCARDAISGDSFSQALEKLDLVTQRTFGRMLDSLQGRTAVVALSGGYDSRFILAMLHRMKYEKIIAFSYGREGNEEMKHAEEVASRLGIKFIPIVYDLAMIDGFELSDDFRGFVNFSANFSSMFFLQEYFAVNYLKNNGLVPEDAVFIPGHSADFLAGSMFLKHGIGEGDESIRRCARRLKHNKCIYAPHPPGTASRFVKSLREKSFSDSPSPWSRYEDWDLKEKFAKFIVNSCNVYAWFGYEYRLPFYDTEFMNFFRDLPYAFKLNKKLYDHYLQEGLFKDLNLNLDHEIQPGEGLQRRVNFRRKIKKLLPPGLLPARLSENDSIFYHEITARLQDDMAARGIALKPWLGTHNSLIIGWYLAWLRLNFPNLVEE